MSTRSCVAYKTEEGWHGIYCHSDGYPTHRGKQIWDIVNNIAKEKGSYEHALKDFISEYIKKHPAGWSSFDDSCYCHGKEWQDRKNSDMIITHENSDPLFIEWVYIVDPKEENMEILCSLGYGVDKEIKDEPTKENGNYDYGHFVGWHSPIASIDFTGEEPLWKDIEDKHDSMHETAESINNQE